MTENTNADLAKRMDTLEKNMAAFWSACRDKAPGIEMISEADASPKLDNSPYPEQHVSGEGDMDMSTRIRRRVTIQGKPQWICASTEQEYAEALLKAMGAVQQAEPPASEKHPFDAYAKRWFEVFSKPNIDQTTAITYERQLKNTILPVLGPMALEDITPAEVQEVFNRMDLGRKKSASTKQKTRMVMNMIFAQAVEDDLIVKNPVKSRSLRIKGKPSKPTETYTVADMAYLSSHIGDLSQPRDRNHLAFQLFHPFRLEEVLGLRWKDVDLQNAVIHIRCTATHPDRNKALFQEKTKTDRSRRDIALVREIIPFLTVGAPEEFVVGGSEPLSYTQVTRMCDRIRRETGFLLR